MLTKQKVHQFYHEGFLVMENMVKEDQDCYCLKHFERLMKKSK